MKNLQRRLVSLERAHRPIGDRSRIAALAMQTGGDDLMVIDGAWVSCPDAAAAMARHDGPLKVYLGFDPREVC